MADAISITRRGMLVGALMAPALALPARAAAVPDHYARFTIGGRALTVDTEDLPQTYTENDTDGVGRPIQFLHSVPDASAEYLVITMRGEMEVTGLCAGEEQFAGQNRRRGMKFEEEGRYRLRTLVTVIGKVVG